MGSGRKILGNLRYPVLLVLSLWKAPKSAPHGDKSRKWNVSKQKRTAVAPKLGVTVEYMRSWPNPVVKSILHRPVKSILTSGPLSRASCPPSALLTRVGKAQSPSSTDPTRGLLTVSRLRSRGSVQGVTAGFVLCRMSAFPLSDPGRLTSRHTPKHKLLSQGGDDRAGGKGVPALQAATKQDKGLGPATFRGLPAPLRTRRWIGPC